VKRKGTSQQRNRRRTTSDQLTTTEDEGETSLKADRLLKENSGVVDDGVATSELL